MIYFLRSETVLKLFMTLFNVIFIIVSREQDGKLLDIRCHNSPLKLEDNSPDKRLLTEHNQYPVPVSIIDQLETRTSSNDPSCQT